ncbi:hypothetical protein GCM10009836_31600 [Pseudonocardia ailaonensis]|uniref:Uncharacterized protein n=1 Tax=Pseudonocardia ailaonensis TaxID=367279 RepID=A0ABN2N573_9PSEU
MTQGEWIRLERFDGAWEAHDPDATFKAEVADHGRLDPLHTLRGLSAHTGIPVGALARYVLAKFATTGSSGLLELGPAMVSRLREPVLRAEEAGTDEARLAAYREISGLLGWLAAPLDDPELYP